MSYIVIRNTKSVGIAILLCLVLGPVGLFYASITGGLFMILIPLSLLAFIFMGLYQGNYELFMGSMALFIVFFLTYWIICIIWATISIKSYNRKILEEARQYQHYEQLKSPTIAIQNNYQGLPEYYHNSSQQANNSNNFPPLEQWLQENPEKSLNDYYFLQRKNSK